MFLELVATFTVGLGVGGLLALANKVSRGRLPRWITPAGAGLAMLLFVIWSEYTWYDRTRNSLPDGLEVAWSNEDSAPWKPWTYLAPQTSRFLALDMASLRTHEALPDQRMVDLYMMGRWMPMRRVTVVVDCAGNRRADLLEGVEMDRSGVIAEENWKPMAADDPVLVTACEGGETTS